MLHHALRASGGAGVEGYLASYAATNSASSYTFSGCNIGKAAANRTIIVAVTSGGISSASLSSATIGGNAATVHSSTSRQITFGFASLVVTSGTTADIVVNFSANRSSGCAIFVYVAYGLASATVAAVSDSGATATGTSRTISLTPNAGDRLIGILFKSTSDASSWTNATKAEDKAIGAGQYTASGYTFGTAAGAVTVTASWASSVSNGMYGGIWR